MKSGLVIKLARKEVRNVYKGRRDIAFHGWMHVKFVYKFSIKFAKSIGADPLLVGLAALTHDFNYLLGHQSQTKEVKKYTRLFLGKLDISKEKIALILSIIEAAETTTRNERISREAKALSDADTLFKALLITPIIFVQGLVQEQHVNLKQISESIISNQQRLFDRDIYFYSKEARRYLDWAQVNFQLWKNVSEFYNDKEFVSFFEKSRE